MQNYEGLLDDNAVSQESEDELEQRISALGTWVSRKNKALIIDAEAEKQDELLQAIRRDDSLYFLPVFCETHSRLSEALSDGLVKDIPARLPQIIERWSQLPVQKHADVLDKLVWFIWSRPNYQLLPLWSPVQSGWLLLPVT